jgi:hypothetical protein
MDEAIRISSVDPTVATNPQALIYAGLGDTGRAFEAAERMASVRPQRLGRYLQYPELALLRADPRLPALREKVGLPRN